MDDLQNKGGKRVCKMCTCACVLICYQLLRRAAGCPMFWTKLSGSSRSGFLPLFTPWLPSAQTIPTRQFSSSATLQGSSLKTMGEFFTQDVYIKPVENEVKSGLSEPYSAN